MAMSNTILAREDGYGVLENAENIIFYAPLTAKDTFSPHLSLHGTETVTSTHVMWSVDKKNDAGIALIGSIVQMDIKSNFKLHSPPSSVLSFPVPASLSSATFLPTAMAPIVPIAGGGDYQRKLIAAHPSRTFELIDYSEKSFALITAEEFGKANTATFTSLRGKYNNNLKHYANGAPVKGWIFAKSNAAAVQALSQMIGMDLTQYTSGVAARDWSKSAPSSYTGAPTVVTLDQPVRAQLQAIGQERTISTVTSELLSLLSCSTEPGEVEIPHPGGDVRKVVWGLQHEVDERIGTIQRDHPGVAMGTEIIGNVRDKRLYVITWSEDH